MNKICTQKCINHFGTIDLTKEDDICMNNCVVKYVSAFQLSAEKIEDYLVKK